MIKKLFLLLFAVFICVLMIFKMQDGIVEKAPLAGDGKIVPVTSKRSLLVYSDNGYLNIKKITKRGLSPKINLNKIINANWETAILDDKNLIVACAGFNKKDLKIYKINLKTGETNLLSKIKKQKDTDLLIDPALTKIGDFYLLSTNKIVGGVNQSDPGKIGKYEILFFVSNDLKNWKEISKIAINEKKNLEDTKLYFNKETGKAYALYEIEDFDKGSSRIFIAESDDYGTSWKDKEIIVNGADNEPAGLVFLKDKILLLYSSDIENLGSFYEGAKGYGVYLDYDLNIIDRSFSLNMGKSILLLDAIKQKDKLVLLGIRNYTNKDKKTIFIKRVNL